MSVVPSHESYEPSYKGLKQEDFTEVKLSLVTNLPIRD